MNILKEQILRTKELMGILNEQIYGGLELLGEKFNTFKELVEIVVNDGKDIPKLNLMGPFKRLVGNLDKALKLYRPHDTELKHKVIEALDDFKRFVDKKKESAKKKTLKIGHKHHDSIINLYPYIEALRAKVLGNNNLGDETLEEQVRIGKHVAGSNILDFKCDKCRWNGRETIYKDSDRVELELRFHNHTGSKTKVIESFEWEGNKRTRSNGYRELEKKAKEVNKKYKIDIKIPTQGKYMLAHGRTRGM